MSFNVSTADGTALAGDDYTAIDSTLEIIAGSLELCFYVSVVDDLIYEDDETLTVTVDASPSNEEVTLNGNNLTKKKVMAPSNHATVTIESDESPLVITSRSLKANENQLDVGTLAAHP